MNCWLKIFLSAFLLILTTAAVSQTIPQPERPLAQIETVVNLGVPAGNGATPQFLALDAQSRKLYIFSAGIPALRQGNGLSVYNLQTGQIEKHAKINRGHNQPLNLQFEPASGLLYALWQEAFTDTPPTLSVINAETLQVMEDIPGIQAIAAGGGQLYAATSQSLAALNPPQVADLERQRVDLPPAAPGPMAVSSAANRLYLARNANGNWSIEIFKADTLGAVASYPAEGQVLNILPLPAQDQVLAVVALDSFRFLYRLTTDGELADLPFEMGPRYGAAGVALSQNGEQLYFSNGQYPPTQNDPPGTPGPALIGLASSANLSPLANIPLPVNFEALAVDDQSNQLFGLYPYDDLLFVIDLSSESTRIINTAIELRDLLFDPGSNQLFIADSANRIRRLNAGTLEPLAETQLQNNLADFGFKATAAPGELSLDPNRNRLYVSGQPATILQADTLAEIATLEPGGQLAPDPTGNALYVSNCGLTVINADTLAQGAPVPGSAPRPDGLVPNPCVVYSKLDAQNRRLYSLTPNGVPGSNGGNYLYVYDTQLEPSLIFTDTELSALLIEPNPATGSAFVGHVRHGNKRLRLLSATPPGPAEYTRQLLGVWGHARYNPAANRLYLSDGETNRLLILQADTLAVIGEIALPPNYNYRLVDLDPATGRLFLIGLDGQLLVISSGDAQPQVDSPAQVAYPPTGAILGLAATDGNTILARIEAQHNGNVDPRLYRTANQGQSWSDLSQSLPNLPAQAIAGQGQTLFAGLTRLGQTGGLYRSTDGGQRWTPAMAGLQDLWVESLFISPNFGRDRLILVKTVHGGLHASTDSGQSWLPLAARNPTAFFPNPVQTAAVAFDGQGAILAGQSFEGAGGIFKATLQPDGALSPWEQVFDQPVSAITFTQNGQTVLAYGSDGLWRSPDGGEAWLAGGAGLTGLDNLQPDQFLVAPDNSAVYLFFKNGFGEPPAKLFRSTDAGQSWQPWLDPVSGGNNFTAIAQLPGGDFIFGSAGTQLTRLSPGSLRWDESGWPAEPFEISSLAASPNFAGDQTLFVLSSQQGLFRSTNGGQNWQAIDFPVRAAHFAPKDFSLAISPNYPQDQTLFIATGRSLHRSTDGGANWSQLTANEPASFPAQKIALSPSFGRDSTLLVSTPAAVYRSTDGGDTWHSVLTPPERASRSDLLAIAPNGQTVFARFGYGQTLFTSSDGGQNWQPQPGSEGELISFIDAAATPDNGLLAAPEYDTRLVQTPPWQPFGQPLPAELTGVQAVVYGSDNAVFVGGPGGIYRSRDGGQSWQPVSSGLPAGANVTNLYSTNTHLFAALANGDIFVSTNAGDSWQKISVVQ